MTPQQIIDKLKAIAVWYSMSDEETEVIKAAIKIIEGSEKHDCKSKCKHSERT